MTATCRDMQGQTLTPTFHPDNANCDKIALVSVSVIPADGEMSIQPAATLLLPQQGALKHTTPKQLVKRALMLVRCCSLTIAG